LKNADIILRNIHGGIFMRIESTDASLISNLTSPKNTHLEASAAAVSAAGGNPNASGQPEAVDTSLGEVSEKMVLEAITKANKAISFANKRFEYSIHEVTKAIMVKVIDKNTDEVIKEIPPEKILDLVAKIWEMAGIIVDERR
jgi:flagellar protein FlaG